MANLATFDPSSPNIRPNPLLTHRPRLLPALFEVASKKTDGDRGVQGIAHLLSGTYTNLNGPVRIN